MTYLNNLWHKKWVQALVVCAASVACHYLVHT